MKYKSIFSLPLHILFFSLFLVSSASALSSLYIRDSEGNFFQRVDFDETSVTESIRMNLYCKYISLFRGHTCVSQVDYDFLTKMAMPQVDPNSTLAIGDTTQEQTQTRPQTETSATAPVHNNQPANTQQPQIIYQVIERAVPGPQGPAGKDGRDGKDGTNSTIASFFPNTAVGAEYIGYGSGSNNSANPTGNGNLASLSVSGDSSFGGKITGAGLLSCNTLTDKILYNSTTGQFECGTDQGGSGFNGGNISAQNVFATTSLQTPVVYASTTNASTSNINTANILNLSVTNATATNLYSSTASISAATTTNFFTSILSSLTSTFINILFTNATGTNATTTNFFTTNLNSLGNFVLGVGTISSTTIADANIGNATITTLHVENFSPNSIAVNLATFTSGTSTNWYTQNASTTNANISNLISTNATFSYATVTNGFFTNLSVTGPVEAALNNGFIFRGGTNNISEATSTIFLADTGKVGIGSTTPAEKLSVQGNLLVSGNIVSPKMSGLIGATAAHMVVCAAADGTISKDFSGDCTTQYSDINLKTNIATVTSILEKVGQLTTVNFNWIDETRGTSTQLGYIAQDVQKVFPEVIKQDDAGFLKVDYLSLSAIYANAIKELLQKVLGIDSRVERLEARMTDLENKLNGQNSLQNTTPPQVEKGVDEPAEEPENEPENDVSGQPEMPPTDTPATE